MNIPRSQQPILAVDDEPAILMLVQDILEGEGFSVLAASDGRSALAMAKTAPVGLVLTDLMMPQMNGEALCLALRAQPTMIHLPVLLMSAVRPPQLAQCFSGFVNKPFSLDQFVREVRHHLAPQHSFTLG